MAFIGIATLSAQTSNGTVIGVITDKTGAAVSGATVTATSEENGAVRTATTNADGTFRIESLLAGTYNVTATAKGFATTVTNGQTVPASSIVTVNLVLNVGSASDQVEVSADNAVINTDNAQISGTIGEMEVSSLPIGSLNPYELALTLPGVMNTQQGGFSNGVDFNVGGGRPRANNFLIEGQDNNDAGIAGQGLQPGNDEAVKEVTIIENAFTAEYGHGAGSVSNLIFKSGTNQLHGAIYERLQNSSLDTVDVSQHYNQTVCLKSGLTAAQCAPSVSKYRENMPGFRVGGPVIKNKVFAFGSYQWDYWRSSAALSALNVPTDAGLALLKQYAAGNPRIAELVKIYSQLPSPGDANAVLKIKLGPDPTTGVDRGTVDVGQVTRNIPAQTNAPELDLKGDWIASSKDTVTLRYIHNSFTAPYDIFNFTNLLPGFDTNQQGAAHNAGIVATHVFSPSVVNEARLSYGRIGFAFGLNPDTKAFLGTPNTGISGLAGWGIPTNMPQGRFHNTYQLQDTVSWTHGKHFIKIGEDIEQVRVEDQIPFNFYGSLAFAGSAGATPVVGGGTYKYSGLANYMDDFAGSGTSVTKNFGSPIATPNLLSQNYFVQDTFHILPTFSLDAGFRYEYTGAPFNTKATPHPGFDPLNPACFPAAGVTCNDKQIPDRDQVGPRFGIAWSPTLFGHNKTVFRAGWGAFYDVVFTNIIDNIQATAPAAASPLITSKSSANGNRGTGTWLEQFANLNPNPKPTNTAEPIYNHLLSPLTMHWNVTVEQELPWATTLQVGYVGERGEHLFGNTQINPIVNYYAGGGRVIGSRGSIVLRDNSEDSQYKGLWTELDHKFNHQFLFRASYTLGQALDDGSEIFTTNNESSYQFSQYPTPRKTTDYGPSEYDYRQRLVMSYIWTPAVWHTEGAMKIVGNVVNHWAVSGITQMQAGAAENVEDGFDVDGDGISNDRPYIGNASAPMRTWAIDGAWFGLANTLCSGPSWWNTNDNCHPVTSDQVHFIVPGPDVHPKYPVARNSMKSPGFQQWDMNIQRSFKATEKVTIDFRGELFNAFNHGNVGIENTTLTSGIVNDQFNPNTGTDYFADPYSATSGHRHARLFMKVSF